MSNKIIYGVLCTVLFSACIKSSQLQKEEVVLSYNQTQCADKWGYGNSDNLTIAKVARYLDSLKLYHSAITIKFDPNLQAVCLACTCTSGKIISVTTSSDITTRTKYEAIGFK